eukprot:CAMPEP_0181181692 /NCGR_PEP_ID=MMETSP1096-20121128/7475_1 /TAXON_ID=156174 ORGANISM="Chrysochromulina ericina, Strain CCMP281" /NCGR_SAMPLE_ID=MMETSP1096 /ASSEMBLY_ACC=CAM_ASM_000453 /LENGTH=58 /DNA_ID=CAMNT_0023270217 /DNA_START=506 /DNA_END=682 /DNA_ORIENTATION=+
MRCAERVAGSNVRARGGMASVVHVPSGKVQTHEHALCNVRIAQAPLGHCGGCSPSSHA